MWGAPREGRAKGIPMVRHLVGEARDDPGHRPRPGEMRQARVGRFVGMESPAHYVQDSGLVSNCDNVVVRAGADVFAYKPDQ